jgi:hypothetical protein
MTQVTEEIYYEVSQELEDTFAKIWKSLHISVDLKYKLIGNSKLKGGIKISKLRDVLSYLTNQEMLIELNENDLYTLDDVAMEIVISQELSKIYIDPNTGKIRLLKPDVITFSGIIKKYSLEDVTRANTLVKLMELTEEERKFIQTTSGLEFGTNDL